MKNSFFLVLWKDLIRICGAKIWLSFLWMAILNIGVVFFEMSVAGAISLFGLILTNPQAIDRLPFLQYPVSILHLSSNISADHHPLLAVLFLVVIASLGKNLLSGYLVLKQTSFAQNISWAVGGELFKRILYAPFVWHLQRKSSELLTLLNWKAVLAAFLGYCFVMCTQVIVALGLIVSALLVTPLESFIMFVSVGFCAWITYYFSRRHAYECGNRIALLDLQTARVVMQGIYSFQDVAISDRQFEYLEAYRQAIPLHVPATAQQAFFGPLPSWILEVFGLLSLLCILIIMATSGESLSTSSMVLALLAATAWRLLPAMNKLVGALLCMRGIQSSVERLFAAVRDIPSISIASPRCVKKISKEIELSDINFSYPEALEPTLRNVNMRIPAGSFVGVVGLSGSGKSTLIKVLTGLYPPESGNVVVDGSVINFTRERLSVGYVPQNLYILDSTLADNVAFRIQNDDIDEGRVRNCCAQAAMSFVDDLPTGIFTKLGEGGVRLSGGQVQRVGIARALYADPDLLIFDEATSALDGAAEQAIQNTVDNIRSDLTVLIVAHRLATVERCDMIYWLDRGMVRMVGAPSLVLPLYRKYLDANSRGSCTSAGAQ